MNNIRIIYEESKNISNQIFKNIELNNNYYILIK